MSHVLRLLHPFAPFVTEEQCELGFGTETIQTTLWPTQSPMTRRECRLANHSIVNLAPGRFLVRLSYVQLN